MFTGGWIIDCGANIGDFTVFASQFGPVRAFEPQQNNFTMLKMNVEINKDKLKHPIEIVKKGVGANGTFTINNESGHSQIGQHGEVCECIDINEATKDLEVIDLLKVDIEGSEYELFENISDETLKKIRYLVMEMHSWRWDDTERHDRLLNKVNEWFDCTRWSIYDSTIGGRNKFYKGLHTFGGENRFHPKKKLK
jgi:FkbM family methyltransferase